ERRFAMEEEDVGHLADQVARLKQQFTVISHQMNAIMSRLGVPHCSCGTCASVSAAHPCPQNGSGKPSVPAAPVLNALYERRLAEEHMQAAQAAVTHQAQPIAVVTLDDTGKMDATPSENGSTSTEEEGKEATDAPLINGVCLMAPTPPADVLQPMPNVATNFFSDRSKGGRKSLHCETPEQKIAVAQYASIHGSTQAARKFGIPPSVAAYYHRKLVKAKQMDATAAVISPMLTSGADRDGLDVSVLNPTSAGMRQRGRPKMIGDELYAELVEHLLKKKQENPGAKLAPEMVLEMARAFIAARSPALLKENGGHIELKNSYATKLISCIAEREKEIELNLPAGSLKNVGLTGLRQLGHSPFTMEGQHPGEALMTDMLLAQLVKIQSQAEPMDDYITPEIMTGKALSLDDFLMGATEDDIEDTPSENGHSNGKDLDVDSLLMMAEETPTD
ncbi:hypothetical protein PENTCL1PPCAC_14635, partial [Pristionchus entomophagus]